MYKSYAVADVCWQGAQYGINSAHGTALTKTIIQGGYLRVTINTKLGPEIMENRPDSGEQGKGNLNT